MVDPVAAGDGAVSAADGLVFEAPTERLEARVVPYWLATDVLRAIVLGAGLVAGSDFAQQQKHALQWLPWLGWGLAGAMLLLAVVMPPLAYARWRYRVDDRVLTMRYGVLFVEERLVPVPRMQHVDLTRGPIERLFGLATLVVFTAGNEGSAFRVPGLRRQVAEELRDRILRARGRDGI